jgi:imidazolonepropionase-like amidohydrolase
MLFTLVAFVVSAAPVVERAPTLKPFIAVDALVTALAHVSVIDGTGAAPLRDQTIVFSGGKIVSVGPSAKAQVPRDAKVLELNGATVLPGLVGMHDHLFMMNQAFPPLRITTPQPVQNARLYLAHGVTTIRTTGTVDPMADLNLKRLVDSGKEPGPNIFVTGPYLEGEGTPFLDMLALRNAEDARLSVEYWASQGATSFKAYMHITRDELVAATTAAHARGLKVTGHLCSIGFKDAVAAGIDNLEHGFFTDSDFVPGRKTDECVDQLLLDKLFAVVDVESPAVKDLIRDLVEHHVAVTSTLAVFEGNYLEESPPRVLELLSPEARENALTAKVRLGGPRKEVRGVVREAVKKEQAMERAFAAAGGTLLVGADPTGAGDILAGVADHRAIELLVEGGFTPLEALRIATKNGAEFLGEGARIGTIAPGKQADLVVVRGDPSKTIGELEKVELVFKGGVGFDPVKLIDSVRGAVGR